MATITPSVPTGFYMEHQTIRFTASGDVTAMAVTQGNSPPSISKYIAYDTLNPPNPFLAITEDGRGRVVYDGGFPKFYNNASFNSATTFAGLNGSCKFLHNAIHWVANPEKVARGERKVLVLGDNTANSSYSPKATRSDGFASVLQMVCNIAGFQMTVKDLSDYGSQLNPSLSELEQYSVVILFGVGTPASALITTQAVNAMVTFRENGNGIIMITDHGPAITNIAQATQAVGGGGFFTTPNAVASRFGAYFTGDFNRVPVGVGFLRSTYGDHPLYNNLANSESIIAGGSESKVVVTSAQTYTPANLPAQTTTINGINYINIMALLNDGSIQSVRFTYIVAGDEVLFVGSNDHGAAVTNNKVFTEASGKLLLNITTSGAALGTMWGEILLNEKRIGVFHEEGGTKRYSLYAGSQTRAKKGDRLEVRNTIPFNYSKVFTIESDIADISALITESRIVRTITNGIGGSFNTALSRLIASINQSAGSAFTPVSTSSKIKLIREASSRKLKSTADLPVAIFATDAECINAIIASGQQMINHAINATSGEIVAWKDGSVKGIGVYAKDIHPPLQKFISNGTAGTWQLNAAGAMVKIA